MLRKKKIDYIVCQSIHLKTKLKNYSLMASLTCPIYFLIIARTNRILLVTDIIIKGTIDKKIGRLKKI